MIKKLKAYEGYIIAIFVLSTLLFTLASFGYKFLNSRLNISFVSDDQNAELSTDSFLIDNAPLPEDAVVIDSIDLAVKKYINAKYNINMKDISVREFQSDGINASGFYKISTFENETFYLAHLKEDKWNVFYDGDMDKAPCDTLNSISFPVGIATDCLDTNTSTVISRL